MNYSILQELQTLSALTNSKPSEFQHILSGGKFELRDGGKMSIFSYEVPENSAFILTDIFCKKAFVNLAQGQAINSVYLHFSHNKKIVTPEFTDWRIISNTSILQIFNKGLVELITKYDVVADEILNIECRISGYLVNSSIAERLQSSTTLVYLQPDANLNSVTQPNIDLTAAHTGDAKRNL